MTVEELRVIVTAQTSQFNNEMDSVKKKINNVSGSSGGLSAMFGKAGTFAKAGAIIGATAMAIGTVAQAIGSCVQAGSELAEVQNVVDVTFGTMKESVNSFAQSAITNFGLSETVAKKYVGTLGSMASSFGFTEQEAYAMATTLTGLTGDIASFYNISSDEAMTKLKSVFSGETESLKELGVVMTQSALDAFAMAKGFGKTTDAMTEQEKVALRYAFVQDKLRNAQGDFARTSDSWANQTRVLSLQFEQLKANLGQGFISALNPVLKGINVLMSKLVIASQYVKAFFEAIFGKQDGGTVGDSIADAMDVGADASGTISSNMEQANKNAKKTADSFKGLAGIDELNTISNNKSESDTSGASVSGINTGAIDIPVTVDTSEATSKVNSFKTTVETVTRKIKEFFAPLLEPLITSINNFMTTCGTTFTAIWQTISAVIQPYLSGIIGSVTIMIQGIITVVQGIVDVVSGIIQMIGGLLTGNKDMLAQGATTLFSGIITVVQGIVQFVSGKFMLIVTAVTAVLETVIKLFANCVTAICGVFKDIGTWFKNNVWSKIKEVFKNVGTWFKTKFTNAWNGIKNVFNGVKTFFSGVWGNVKTAFSNVGTWFSTQFTNAWTNIKNAFNGVKTFFTNLWTKIKSCFTDIGTKAGDAVSGGFKTVVNGILKTIEDTINGAIGFINSAMDVINAIPGVDIGNIDEIELPRLAKGGITLGSTIANIGEDGKEAVLPLEKNTEWMATLASQLVAQMGNNNSNQPIEITLNVGGTKFGKACINSINQAQKQSGAILLNI